MGIEFDCQRCGACCAAFRVAFYWGESDQLPGGLVPIALTQPLRHHELCMRGTDSKEPHCIALQGRLGEWVSCAIYDRRPSPCREVTPGDRHCLAARARRGISDDPAQGQASVLPISPEIL